MKILAKIKILRFFDKLLRGILVFSLVGSAVLLTSAYTKHIYHVQSPVAAEKKGKDFHLIFRPVVVVKPSVAQSTALPEAKAAEVAPQVIIPQTEAEWTTLLLRQKALAAGLTDKDVATLTRIAKCESALHNVPNKDGESSAIGAFQILAMHNSKGNRYATEGNEDIAIKLYKQQGTTPWNSSKYCWKE